MVSDNAYDQSAPQEDSDEKDRRASTLDHDELFTRLKKWCIKDRDHWSDWRIEAKEAYEFDAGRQYSDEDLAILRDQMRPVVSFNRIAPVINAVSGTEVSNRQEVRYLPREEGDAAPNEILTAAGQWFRDECNAEDEESDAFRDCLVCGVGNTETRMDFELDQDGAPITDRVDPFEVIWDSASRKRNFEDARRVFRIRRVPRDEALSLVPGVDPDELDAKWAVPDGGQNSSETREEARYYRETEGDNKDENERSDELITLVEAQWWEREMIHAVIGPDGALQMLEHDQFEAFSERMRELGETPKSAAQTRRRHYRAYLGKSLLAEPDKEPYGPNFSLNAMTGYRDRNTGTYFGMERGMHDPQMWANKWLSQTMHIMNTSAKGGALIEKGVFEDEREAEKNWSRPDKFVYVRQGALSGANGPKIQQKPGAPLLPVQSGEMMQFALQSIRDASGVNLELLGMKDQEQAGVLEMQRKKQAMAVLASLFDSLRRYRKRQGRLQLWLIQNLVSDGRMIRITGGQGQAKYLPLIRQPGAATYDVIVDDAPTSPQQKELTWAFLVQLLPMIRDQMSPEMLAMMLEYSPLPASAVQKIQQSVMQNQAQAAQAGQETQAIVKAGAIAKVNETQSKADLNRAKAGKELNDVHQAATQPQVQPNSGQNRNFG